jgi:type I restriction enzyme M protein
MITGEMKSKVDRIWDTMWSGGISNPMNDQPEHKAD